MPPIAGQLLFMILLQLREQQNGGYSRVVKPYDSVIVDILQNHQRFRCLPTFIMKDVAGQTGLDVDLGSGIRIPSSGGSQQIRGI